MKMYPTFELNPTLLTWDDLTLLFQQQRSLTLSKATWNNIALSHQYILSLVEKKVVAYGVNTGFGRLATQVIANDDLEQLQHNLLLSHASGVGELLPTSIVKLILLLKINSLASGYSGIRKIIVERLIELYNHEIYPCVPALGSVGASGDIAPLAHLALPLIGEGTVNYKNKIIASKELEHILQWTPLRLAPKEGLALINGTQTSTAIALYYLMIAKKLLHAAIKIGALTTDAVIGNLSAFDPKIHLLRNQQGQIKVAQEFIALLQASKMRIQHNNLVKIQDPYSIRCQPQVLGACSDNIDHATVILLREANAVTDNPLIFAEENQILSGGNFHAEPIAQIADLIAIASSEIGAISERKIALMLDPNFNNGLPAFLTPSAGINSGFMNAQVTAAALASANKALAHPVSVDSIPTSANQEDHVSMATYAAWRLKYITEQVQTILGIELLAATQALELRRPGRSSPKVEAIFQKVRLQIPFWQQDRFLAPDIELAKQLVFEI